MKNWNRAACGVLTLCASFAFAAEDGRTGGPYVPTPPAVVDAMLELARVGRRDFVVDLGSGDGRVVLAAATKYRARGMGVDIDQELVEMSNAAARRLGMTGRVHFRRQDVLAADLSRATVLTLYLMPEMMRSLQPKLLRELRPGARIVSHDFDLGNWKPDRSITMETTEKYDLTGSTWTSTVHLWIVPAAIEGAWRGKRSDEPGAAFRLEIKQNFQRVEGTLTRGGRPMKLQGARLEGARLRFSVRGEDGRRERFTATVAGATMRGEARTDGAAAAAPWSAARLP